MENPSIPVENETSRFLAYETRISDLATEVTRLKVENVSLNNRLSMLHNLLHANGIRLPEETAEIEKKEQILLKEKKVIFLVRTSSYVGTRRKGSDGSSRYAEVDNQRSGRN